MDFISKLIDIDEKIKSKPILYLYRFFSYIFVGIPLIVFVILHMIICKIRIKDKYSGRTEIVFAWYPVRTDSGYVWLQNVKRTVYANSDMISYLQYRYTKI